MTAELLGRLNAKGSDLRMLPPGFGRYTQADVAHALSFVQSKGARLVGRVRYARQMEFADELIHELVMGLKRKAKRERWKGIAPITRIATVAVSMYASPRRCQQCQGVGARKWGAKVLVCDKCKGSSWETTANEDIIGAIGVDAEAWDKTWQRRFGFAMEELGRWDSECIRDLRKALNDATV